MRNKRKTTYRGRPKRMPARDAFSNPMARLGAGTPNLLDSTYYPMQRLTRNYQLLNSLYREHWIMRRIIDVIPSDMLKNWITITTEVDPELLKRVDLELRRTQLIEKIKHGLKWGRLYGGAIGIMVIKGQGNNLSEPLDTERMVPGDFCGLLIFDRWNGVEPSMTLVEDITDSEYGMPAYYTVTDTVSGKSVSVHYSRVVRFTGDELPFWESQSEQLGGASVIESVFEELKKRDNVSWNIAQLTFMASLRVLKMNDLGQMLAASDEASQKELYNTIQAQNWLMSNMGLQVIDAADGIESHQYTFGGLSEVYQQFMMDISGAAQIPATKLFGRSPSGMNATGESDLQNYYEMIGQEQESKLRPILNKILPVLCMSVFGAVPDDLDFDFDPVSEPSDQERSDLAKSGTENVVAALNAGLVSKRTALKELKQQSERTGVWTNITDQDIMNASDEIEEEGEMGGMPGIPDFQNSVNDDGYTKDPNPDNWKTIKGAKVHLDETGSIDGGAGGKFNGRKFGQKVVTNSGETIKKQETENLTGAAINEKEIAKEKSESAESKNIKPMAKHSRLVFNIDNPYERMDCINETVKRMCMGRNYDSGLKKEVSEQLKFIDDYSFNKYEEIRSDKTEYAQEANRKIDKFIENSPTFEGTIYRGMSVTKDELDMYMQYASSGTVFDQRGVSSWSSERKVAKSFIQTSYPRKFGVIFIKEGTGFKNSTSIRHMAVHHKENEVLVHRKTKMKITKFRKSSGTYCFVVEEVDGNE